MTAARQQEHGDDRGEQQERLAEGVESEITSDQARFLLVTEPAGLERFMRAAGAPAQSLTLPPPPSEPPDPARLAALAAEVGIEILGPPGIPN